MMTTTRTGGGDVVLLSLSYKKVSIEEALRIIDELRVRGASHITMTVHWPKPPRAVPREALALPFTQADTYAGILNDALESFRAGQELYQFDPLGNLVTLSNVPDDCPNPGCSFIFPHLHSRIKPK